MKTKLPLFLLLAASAPRAEGHDIVVDPLTGRAHIRPAPAAFPYFEGLPGIDASGVHTVANGAGLAARDEAERVLRGMLAHSPRAVVTRFAASNIRIVVIPEARNAVDRSGLATSSGLPLDSVRQPGRRRLSDGSWGIFVRETDLKDPGGHPESVYELALAIHDFGVEHPLGEAALPFAVAAIRWFGADAGQAHALRDSQPGVFEALHDAFGPARDLAQN